jgi:hypothetical protein
MAAAAALGLVVSLVAYLRRGSGVDHTAGALLVIISTVLLAGDAAVLALTAQMRGRWRGLLIALAILDVVGTGVAAWFLHAWLLLILMVVALVGWIAALRPAPRAGSRLSAA